MNTTNNSALPQKLASKIDYQWLYGNKTIAMTSLLSALILESAQAQGTPPPINVAAGTTSTAPVVLDEAGEVLNNEGTIAVAGAGSTTVASSADNTTINNGVGANPGTITGDSRAVDFTAGSGGTLNNSAGSQILATGDQRNGTVYADSDTNNVTINNEGLIDARGAGSSPTSALQGAGFSTELSAAGNNIDITNSGTIAGSGQAAAGAATAGDGVRFERTRVAGMLDGTTSGLLNGTINNSGTISSESTQGTTAGVRFVNGTSFNGTIENSGTIEGAQNGLYFGNATPAGGGDFTDAVVNNSGIISSDSRALNIDGTGLTVNNTGQILGTADQRNGTVYADSTAQDFTLNNQAAGVIDAGAGNSGAGFSVELSEDGNDFDINNEGTIAGRGQAAAGATTAGDGLRFERTRVAGMLDGTTSGLFTGDINNSGTISSDSTQGTTAGVRFVNGTSFSGTIENSGTIEGAQNGLYFGNATPAGGGDFTDAVVNNSGIISSDSRALNIDGTGLTVNNTGQILGTADQRNGTVYADSTAQDFTLNNQAAGVIDAGIGNSGAGFSVELSEDGNDFDINNEGAIEGRGQAAAGATTAGDGLRFERTRVAGMLDGSTSGLFTGDINNSGIISSESTQGTTAGIRFVNGTSFSGTIENSGIIDGAQNGLYFGNATPAGGGDFTDAVVNNSGIISSGSRALNIDGTGLTVNNSGAIIGTDNQRNGTVYADSTAQDFTLNNQAAGVIDAGIGNSGAGFSVELSAPGNDFDINNEGTIAGRGQAGAGATTAGDGLRFERTRVAGVLDASTSGLFTGDINNSGIISSDSTQGTTAGIRFVNGTSFSGTIENSGTIDGAQNGLYFGNATPAGGGDFTGAVVNNSGIISSASRALNIDGTGLTVNNSGQIIGTANQRNGTVYADSSAQDFTLNNQATGVIDAGAGNSGAGFSVELSAPGNDFDINNEGTIAGRGQAGAGATTAGDGLRFERTRVAGMLDGSTTGLFTGDINNSGIISSDSTQGTTAGIRFVNGTSFSGTIENSGTIDGAQNGLYFGNATPAGGGDFTGAVVNNSGIISSASRALNIDGTGLTANNSGQILGTGDQRNGTVYFDGTATNSTFNNQTGGLVDAGLGNNGSGVSIQTGASSLGNVVTNSGTIQGRGAALPSGAAAGVRVFGTGTADTAITNNAGGSINSESSAGILIEGVNFTGSITNNGDISGTTASIDTTTALGNITIEQGGGSLTGDVLTGAGDDVLNVTGDSSVNGNIALGAGDNALNILSGGSLGFEQTGDVNITGGDVNVASGGTLAVDLGNDQSINTTGDIVLENNSTLEIQATNFDVLDLGTNPTVTVLNSDGTITDNGVQVIDNNLLIDFEEVLAAPGTGAQFNLVASAADVSALTTGNAADFASAFQSTLVAGTGNAAFNTTATLLNALSVSDFTLASEQLLPTLNTGVTRELYEAQSSAFNTIERQLALSNVHGEGIWFEAFGRSADRDSSGSFEGYDADSFGFTLGAQSQLNDNLTVGLGFTYADISVDENGIASESTDIDYYSFNAYAGYKKDNYFINALISYGTGDADSDRNGLSDEIESDFDLDQFSVKLSAGLEKQYGRHTLSPFASLQYGQTSQDSFTEDGGLGLRVSAEDVAVLEAGIGIGYSTVINQPSAAAKGLARFHTTLNLEAGWYYDFLTEERELDVAIPSGDEFSIRGDEDSSSSFEFDAGINVQLRENIELSAGYRGEFRSDFNSHTGRIGIHYSF